MLRRLHHILIAQLGKRNGNMRATEFLLLEYSREKTAQVFGKKLIAALTVDKRPSDFLSPTRAYLSQKAKIGSEVPLDDQQLILNNVLEELERADPTQTKEYVQWLAKCYANEKVPSEDLISNGMDALKNYHQFKVKKLLPPEWRNIMNLTFLQMAMIAHDPDLVAKLKAADDAKADKGQAKTVFENDQVRIIMPQDEAAAKYYGQGTRWCTAAKNNNMFNRYNKEGAMYILLPKQPKHDGEKYQIHFETGQFMDEEDNSVTDLNGLFRERFGDLVPVFKQIKPEISEYVIFADDDQISLILDEIKEISYEWINEWLSDFESEDDEWLDHVSQYTTDGDVDWDAAGDYLDFNSYARDVYNDLENAVDIDVQSAKALANVMFEEGDDVVKVDQLEYVVAVAVRHRGQVARRHRKNGDLVFRKFSEWIEWHIKVENGKARKV